MKLDELLNKVLKYETTEDTPNFFQAEFVSNGRIISFAFDHQFKYDDLAIDADPEYKGDWSCEFNERSLSKGNTRHDVTGSGGEFEVFATLKAILKEFFAKHKPNSIIFDADKGEGSRANLYQKLFTKGLPAGYELKRDDEGGRFNVKFSVVKTG